MVLCHTSPLVLTDEAFDLLQKSAPQQRCTIAIGELPPENDGIVREDEQLYCLTFSVEMSYEEKGESFDGDAPHWARAMACAQWISGYVTPDFAFSIEMQEGVYTPEDNILQLTSKVVVFAAARMVHIFDSVTVHQLTASYGRTVM